MGALDGLKVVEVMSAVGPGKFCSMMLAEMGADVIIVERPSLERGMPRPYVVFNRGKRSIMLDLKNPIAVDAVLKLVDDADVFLEGMRPGVMERLGLGPEVCLARRPSLVYGRLTGWGQSGPLSQAPGYDSTFVALSGALSLASDAGERPEAPPGLFGDVCGGALNLTLGVLAAVFRARSDGRGQVVDAAMVDGAANLLNWELSNIAAASMREGKHDGSGKPWIRSYRCADGKWIRVETYEPQFYAELVERLGLADDERFVGAWNNTQDWTSITVELEAQFATKTRDEWSALLEGTNACVAPVLDPTEAATHRHNVSRGVYEVVDGVLQVAPAPRFSATPSSRGLRVPPVGAHTRDILSGLGFADANIDELSGDVS
jgi:crotonobetainyl-CoA:carnitine CoA-transferase CaiB-like acyl-CoA transferase